MSTHTAAPGGRATSAPIMGHDEEPTVFELSVEGRKAWSFPRTDLPEWSAPRTSQEPRVKHTVRVSPTNRQKLEDIRREVGAPSRNLLIVTAYKAFLPPINES